MMEYNNIYKYLIPFFYIRGVICIAREDKLREAFGKIKEEMNDHLDSINENTREINANSDYMHRLEIMLNKMSERMDELELQMREITGNEIMPQPKNISLTPKEKEIFLQLYSRTGDLLDYREIARSLGYTVEMTRRLIGSIIQKGVPIAKKSYDGNIYLVLDSEFRTLHAKTSIVQ